MINVALLSVIRRWHLREQMSIREIARRTGLSRNTVRKYLKDGVVTPAYPKRKARSKLDAFSPQLTEWLEREWSRGRKQRRNVKELFLALRGIGYSGSYDRVCAFARQWQRRKQERLQVAGRGTFVPLVFGPGEAFQFDWSEDWAVLAGERTKLQVAHFKLCYSRAFLLRAYLLQSQEMLFDAHNHAFAVFGGVPRRGVYDNMATAVDRIGPGKSREVNSRFAAMVSHYLYEAEFCNRAAGWEKGRVEKNVRDARPRLWHCVPDFDTLPALNAWLVERCMALWQQSAHPEQPDSTIAQLWQEERLQLLPVSQSFDGYIEHTKRVSPTCLVNFERNRYSVPASFANRPVSLRVYADRVLVVAEGQIVADHVRLIERKHGPGRSIYDWRHYLSVLQRKPGALRNGAPFAELPDAFKRLQALMLKRQGGDREMVEILALVLHHDEQAVLTAVELALESGNPSKEHVLNILRRLLEEARPAPIDAPQGLQLSVESEANVSRYDGLREVNRAA